MHVITCLYDYNTSSPDCKHQTSLALTNTILDRGPLKKLQAMYSYLADFPFVRRPSSTKPDVKTNLVCRLYSILKSKAKSTRIFLGFFLFLSYLTWHYVYFMREANLPLHKSNSSVEITMSFTMIYYKNILFWRAICSQVDWLNFPTKYGTLHTPVTLLSWLLNIRPKIKLLSW